MRSVAASIYDYTGSVVGAVSVSVPAMRFSKARMQDELTPFVRSAAEEISGLLGYLSEDATITCAEACGPTGGCIHRTASVTTLESGSINYVRLSAQSNSRISFCLSRISRPSEMAFARLLRRNFPKLTSIACLTVMLHFPLTDLEEADDPATIFIKPRKE